MFKMSDKTYSILKWSIIIFLPACGVLYTTLAKLYNLPYAEEVVGTLSAICVFLGTIFCISSAEYNKEEREKEVQDSIEEIEKRKELPQQVEEPTVEEPKVEEPKVEEPTEEPQDNGSQGIGGSCICEQGKSYILTCNVKVRESYGTDARWLKRDELTEDGKAHSLDGEYAVLEQGTEVYCQEVYYNWIKIPSGWICARDMDGTDNVSAQAKWQFPVNYVGIATGFSNPSHLAYDFGFSDNPNQPIFAPCACTVSACGYDSVVGNYVYANFNGYTWRFIHLSDYSVSVGQSLAQGQQVGLMGNTGSSSGGSHLHLDLWNGTYVGSMPSDRAGASVDYLSMLYLYPHQSVGEVTNANYRINRA